MVQIFVLCCDLSFLVTDAYTLMIKMIKLVPFYLDALSVSEIEFLCFFSLIMHILKVTVTMGCVFPPL